MTHYIANSNGSAQAIDSPAPLPELVRISHTWGKGEWHDIKHEADLIAKCNDLNTRYPEGGHHTEYTILDHGTLGPQWVIDEIAKADRPGPQLVDREAPMAVDVPTLPEAEDNTFWPAVWHGLASIANIALCGIAGCWLALAYLGVW